MDGPKLETSKNNKKKSTNREYKLSEMTNILADNLKFQTARNQQVVQKL